MKDGKILYSGVNGVFVVRFIGDVRVTLCMTIENCLNLLVDDLSLTSVVVDLTQAEGIDSTSLGLIAKLGILGKNLTKKPVSIISTNSDITRLLVSMGFKDTLFVILDNIPSLANAIDLEEVPNQSCTEQEAKQRVIEAHKILMNLNADNAAKFSDLVNVLEQSP
jgi:anti-anti-sigma regulatory factor